MNTSVSLNALTDVAIHNILTHSIVQARVTVAQTNLNTAQVHGCKQIVMIIVTIMIGGGGGVMTVVMMVRVRRGRTNRRTRMKRKIRITK